MRGRETKRDRDRVEKGKKGQREGIRPREEEKREDKRREEKKKM